MMILIMIMIMTTYINAIFILFARSPPPQGAGFVNGSSIEQSLSTPSSTTMSLGPKTSSPFSTSSSFGLSTTPSFGLPSFDIATSLGPPSLGPGSLGVPSLGPPPPSSSLGLSMTSLSLSTPLPLGLSSTTALSMGLTTTTTPKMASRSLSSCISPTTRGVYWIYVYLKKYTSWVHVYQILILVNFALLR